MKKLWNVILLAYLAVFTDAIQAHDKHPVAIAIHGGAGTILKANMTPELEKQYIATLTQAVQTGHALLAAGEPGETAVIETIKVLENSPLFNAGIGAVYTFDGTHELDASIMHGGTLNAGAIAGVTTVKNPIELATAVMHQSPHVLLSGRGAEAFAQSIGIATVDNSIFNTPSRRRALERAKTRIAETASRFGGQIGNERFGTVGAVVLDQAGNIVAGTSTGGMTAKRYGRVGDSPIIGAGTYANNDSCAVSATGHGEFFIRYNVAADICARMKYQGLSIDKAADEVVMKVLKEAGGDGGVIAIDKHGNIATPFNTPGMYRAKITFDGRLAVGIYQDWVK